MAESLRINGNPLAREARARARKYYAWAQEWERHATVWDRNAQIWARMGEADKAAESMERVSTDLGFAAERRQWAREEMRRARSLARGK